MIDFHRDAFGGRVCGLCSECSTLMFKRVSDRTVERLKSELDVVTIEGTPTPK
jgi:hypothetical protein